MINITIGIKGISPLLMNHFTEEAAMRSSEGSSSASSAQDRGTPWEIANAKIYRDDKGKIVIPATNIMRCFVDGGVFEKTGTKQVTTKERSLLYACLAIEGICADLHYRDPWSVKSDPVVNPKTKGRILCHRAIFHDWSLEVVAELDESIINPKLLRQIIDHSGKRIGLGDWRPARKGPYGKFVVVKWIEKQLKPPKVSVEMREVA